MPEEKALPIPVVFNGTRTILATAPDEVTATTFSHSAIGNNGLPEKAVVGKSGANFAGLTNINIDLFLVGCWYSFIGILQVKYLNIIEQAHHFIKRVTKPMIGLKAFQSAQATIAGIESAHLIRKRQLN